MRTATLVLVAYAMCVIVAAMWHRLPIGIGKDAIPDIGALTAAYLGLTARRQASSAVGGSVVVGYLGDLISGGPSGLTALVLGFTSLIARGVQQRILVRGTTMTMAFSAFVALTSSVIALVVRKLFGVALAGVAVELQHIALGAVATALVSPLIWRIFRRIDAAFARTHRERDAALEGLAP